MIKILRSPLSGMFYRNGISQLKFMKCFHEKLILKISLCLTILLMVVSNSFGQQYQMIGVTGFNNDLVANGSGGPASTSTSVAMDAQGTVMYVKGYQGCVGTLQYGLPQNGFITSANNSSLTYQMAPFNQNNALLLYAGQSGVLTFNTSGSYDLISILATSSEGSSSFSATLNFSDGTSSTYSFGVPDWYNGYPYAISGFGRVSRLYCNTDESAGNPRLYDNVINLNPGDKQKLLKSVSFHSNGYGYTSIYAITGRTVVNSPTTPLNPFANNISSAGFNANWTAVPNATSYNLDVSTDPNFGSFVGVYNNYNVGNVTSVPVSASIGTYYFRVRAVNSAGQSLSSTTVSVIVKDDIVPIAKSKDVVVYLNQSGSASITPQTIDNGSSDNSGSVSLSIDRSTFSCSDLDAKSVATIVSDASWKQSTYNTSTPKPYVSVISQLPAASTYTLAANVQNPYNTPNFFQPPVPGASPIRSFSGLKFFRNEFVLTGRPESLRLRARVDNVMEIFINGVSVGIEGDFDTKNFNNTVYHDLYIDETGVHNGYQGGMQFDQVTSQSILDLLHEGSNEIVFAIGNDNIATDDGGFMVRMDAVAAGVPVVLTATDPSGNKSTSTSFVVVKDNIAPTFNAVSDTTVYATSAAGAVVNYNIPTATDNCSATVALVSGPASGSTFPIGTTKVTYRATDGSGNFSERSFNVIVSGLAPQIVSPGNITVNASQGLCGANVNFAATETTAVPTSAITYSIQPGSLFNLGTTTVKATATNPVGTSSTTFTVTVVDNILPTITLNGASTINQPAYTPYTDLGATATDNCSATVTVDNPVNVNIPGTYTVTYTAKDPSGNIATATRTVIVKDDIAPIAKSKDVVVYLNQSGSASITPQTIDNGSSDNSGSVSLSIDRSTFSCSDLGARNVATIVSDASWKQSTYNPATPFPFVSVVNQLPAVSTYTLPATVDNPYNVVGFFKPAIPDAQPIRAFSGLKFFRNQFVLTGRPQSLRLRARVDNVMEIFINGVSVGIEGSIDTKNFNNTVYHDLYIDETGVHNGYQGGMQFDQVTSQSILDLLHEGSNEIVFAIGNENRPNDDGGFMVRMDAVADGVPVVLTATDPSGNKSNTTAFVVVKDNIAPTINAVSDTTVYATSAAGAVVNYNIPTATDNCSATVALVSGSASGSTFPIGTTKVTYRATDGSGNFSERSFNVIVTGLPPQIVGPGNISVNNDAGQCGAKVNFAATETVGIPASTITYSIQPGSYFNVGTTKVTATATNPVGTSSVTFDVVINDTEKPIVLTQNKTIQLNASGQATITTADINNGSYDNCGIQSLSLDKTAFDCSNFGANTVTLTVTDVHGNVSKGTATVTVEDHIAPTVITKNISILLNDAGQATITASDIDNGSKDNCAIQSISIDKTAFDCSNYGANTVTLTVTDIHGNVASNTATVMVGDHIAPTITAPVSQEICFNASNQYSIPLLVSTDNCAVASTSFVLSGATTRSGSTNDASGLFNTGVTTISWTVTDVHGNSSTATQQITIWPLPVLSLTPSTPDDFCNAVTVTPSSTIPVVSYNWMHNNVTFSTNADLHLSIADEDGTYELYVTDIHGCVNTQIASYTYNKESLASSYTILGIRGVKLGENNNVQTGSVGAMGTKGKVSIEENSSVSATGAFVKAKYIKVDRRATVPTQINAPVVADLPTMEYFNGYTKGLPKYEAKSNTTLTGNYSNLTVKKGISVTLTGNLFGTIKVEDGATVSFTSPVINIMDLNVDGSDGKSDNHDNQRGKYSHDDAHQATQSPYTTIKFSADAVVKVSDKVDIGGHSIINPDGHKVIFFVGSIKNHSKGRGSHDEGDNCPSYKQGDDHRNRDNEKDDEDDDYYGKGQFKVNGGDVYVTASVYVPEGKIMVNGGEKATSYLTGMFIGEYVQSDTKNVVWNGFNCQVSNTAATPQVLTTNGVPNAMDKSGMINLEVTVPGVSKLVAYPNPFTMNTTVSFSLPYDESNATLDIYDLRGVKIQSIFKGTANANQTYELKFNGQSIAAGTYFFRLITSKEVKNFKVIMK